MTSYTEHELIVPSLKIISKNKDGIDTKKLIDELRKLLKPNGEDILVLSNRADDKFSQKVRNLKSHRSLEKKGLAKFNNNRYLITEDGVIYLNQRDDYLDFEKDEIIFNFVPLKYLNFDNKIIHFLKRENGLRRSRDFSRTALGGVSDDLGRGFDSEITSGDLLEIRNHLPRPSRDSKSLPESFSRLEITSQDILETQNHITRGSRDSKSPPETV